jgi:D-sedoheptulose 7-phosphate isomerase
MKEKIARIFDEHARVQKEFLKTTADTLATVCALCVEAFRKGRRLLLFGNGGSAADTQHIAGEFVNRFRVDRRALPAISLNTDVAVLTSIANDAGYDRVFARQIEALGSPDDVAFGFSTSGTSPNVIEGIRAARRLGLVTVGFAGRDGGALARETDYCITVASASTPRVQELHMLAAHALCDIVEQEIVHPTHETP